MTDELPAPHGIVTTPNPDADVDGPAWHVELTDEGDLRIRTAGCDQSVTVTDGYEETGHTLFGPVSIPEYTICLEEME